MRYIAAIRGCNNVFENFKQQLPLMVHIHKVFKHCTMTYISGMHLILQYLGHIAIKSIVLRFEGK